MRRRVAGAMRVHATSRRSAVDREVADEIEEFVTANFARRWRRLSRRGDVARRVEDDDRARKRFHRAGIVRTRGERGALVSPKLVRIRMKSKSARRRD